MASVEQRALEDARLLAALERERRVTVAAAAITSPNAQAQTKRKMRGYARRAVDALAADRPPEEALRRAGFVTHNGLAIGTDCVMRVVRALRGDD